MCIYRLIYILYRIFLILASELQLPKLESCCDEYLRFTDGDVIELTCDDGNM